MASSSPSPLYPTTPACPRFPLLYKPLNSSPLVASPDSRKMSSPVAAAQARRRSQYKSAVGHPMRDSGPARRLFSSGSEAVTTEAADPQKAFLRSRFKARCFERAAEARERAIHGKRTRSLSEPSSDDYPMDEDDDEEDDDIMQDELFRRIMANAARKQTHSYRVSYAQEVGSSYDPDIEDASRWEQELATAAVQPPAPNFSSSASPSGTRSKSHFRSLPPSTTFTNAFSWMEDDEDPAASIPDDLELSIPDDLDLTPVDLADEELEAYAEECARRAAVADFEDIPVEELLDRWSEDEDEGWWSSQTQTHIDDGMDMS